MQRRCAVRDLLDHEIKEPRTRRTNTAHHFPLAPFKLGKRGERNLVGEIGKGDRQSFDFPSRHLRNMCAYGGLPQQGLCCRRAQKGDQERRMDSPVVCAKSQERRGNYRGPVQTHELGHPIAAAAGLEDHVAGLQPGLWRRWQLPEAGGGVSPNEAFSLKVAGLNHDHPAVWIVLNPRPEGETGMDLNDVAELHILIRQGLAAKNISTVGHVVN